MKYVTCTFMIYNVFNIKSTTPQLWLNILHSAFQINVIALGIKVIYKLHYGIS